ncbi:MAG TPA: monooxygenase [Kineosporiaceae bacterium]|nr:monooxygenase [Kineosporiaceae bacterium]
MNDGLARPDPPVVTMTLWGVDRARIPAATARMVLDRRHLRRTPGLRFSKLLGTGDGRTFTPRDADPRHWGLLAVWDDETTAAAFADGPIVRAWLRLDAEQLLVRMSPTASRGSWSGQTPFGEPVPRRVGGPVAAITRARIRLRKSRTFWSAVPPVSTDLQSAPGLRLAVGIGEAPVGLQGTFSLWDRPESLIDFAHRRAAHREVVARTVTERWYVEELFARFEVLSVEGSFNGREPVTVVPAS